MLLCVLREISKDNDTALGLDTRIRVSGMKVLGIEDRFRLCQRERDRKFFQEHIQEMGRLDNFVESDPVNFSDSRKRIHENMNYLNKELLKLNEKQREDLIAFVLQKCYIVVVETSDGESAYRIFSVLNDRGLDLSPTDILKADVIGKMPADSQNDYADKWEEIEDELGRDRFRDLFAHIRMIHRKGKLRGTLEREFGITSFET